MWEEMDTTTTTVEQTTNVGGYGHDNNDYERMSIGSATSKQQST
jgi:hypothetical protein